MAERVSIHGQWSSRLAFILAATGSAVGLGNIWRFPYETGVNGGGAFVVIYLLCIALIGLPVMIAEIMLGRRGRQSPINTMATLAREEGHSNWWGGLGWMGVLAGFFILSFYSVVAGWTLAYVVETVATGGFKGIDAAASGEKFGALISDPWTLLGWHTLFMAMTMLVVARGVQSGLERAVTLLMPTLFALLILLVGYAMATGAFNEALSFMFTVRFDQISSEGVLSAMGQAFFSLSLGMGAIMVYGSYLPNDSSIARTAVTVALADTAVALLAGLAIFPIVFGSGLEPGSGPSLIFQTLPIAFGEMSLGLFVGAAFFILLAFAAWTSAISLVEPAVAYLVENRGHTRLFASFLVGGLAWLLGIGALLSFNLWSDYTLWGLTFFDLLEYLTTKIMLPLGGLFIAIFAVWVMSESSSRHELGKSEPKINAIFPFWRFAVRYIAPIAIVAIFLNVIGVFDAIGQLVGLSGAEQGGAGA